MDISRMIDESWGIAYPTQMKFVYTFLSLAVIILVRYLLTRVINRRVSDLKDRYYWATAINYISNGIFLISLIIVWFSEFRSIATVIGLVSAGLTIALKDLVINFAGWLFIVIRKPFGIGDRVEVGLYKGDVIDIRLFQFTINEIGNWVDADQSTGRIVHIPNGKVFTEPQANFTQGFSHIWNEIGVLVTFESDWQKAKEILKEIVNDHAAHLTRAAEQRLIDASRQYMILYNRLTPIVYTSVKENGVMLTMRYLITPRRRRTSEQSIWEDVLKQFAEHQDIDFAYPTQRIYYNPTEKKGAGPETKPPQV